MHVILLSAGVGKRLAPYTEARPKCLMDVGGSTLLERHLTHASRNHADQITVVTGHLKEMIAAEIETLAGKKGLFRPKIVENDRYRQGSIVSLSVGLEGIDDDVIFMDTDVLYDARVLSRLFETKNRSCVLVDATSQETGEEMMIGVRRDRAVRVARRVSPLGTFDVIGESVGFFRVAREHLPALRDAIETVIREKGENNEYEDAVNRLFDAVEVGVERVDDLEWTEIDFADDLRRAREEIAPKLAPLHETTARGH